MHHRAGRAIRAVLEGNVPEPVRNEAAYRLGRVQYEKGDMEAAAAALARIQGELPVAVRDDAELLRAQVLIATGRAAEAVAPLEKLRGAAGMEGFAGFNLGVALLQLEREEEGRDALRRAGGIDAKDEPARAIRDKANLALGYRLLAAGEHEAARQVLDKVRLAGPFSDKALLGAGWAEMHLGRHDRALVPWSLLARRNATGKAVQESLLGMPYAYARLGLHGRAALMYGSALEVFGNEVDRLGASIDSIRAGRFLAALAREELRHDGNWVLRLRALPEAPETYYLMDLMAANDFQSALRNYVDLVDLQRRLQRWDQELDAFEDVIERRRRYYEPLLPAIDKRFRVIDSQVRLRLEQRAGLDERLRELLVAPNPDTLITADERLLRDRLRELAGSAAGAEQRRLARLQGVLHWDIVTGYDQRLTDAWRHLRELDADVARLQAIQHGFVRSRQAATQSYEGYGPRLVQARSRIRAAQESVAGLLARQGRMLENMAVAELDQRRRRLEDYKVKARFAMAESYDRALKARQAAEVSAK
jgi:tetratricopeptide (TPR) repeat protein